MDPLTRLRRLRSLGAIAVAVLVMGAVLQLAAAASQMREAGLLRILRDEGSSAFSVSGAQDAEHFVNVTLVLALLGSLLVLLSMALITNRAMHVLRSIGVMDLRHGTGWAFWGWFTPVADLVVPKQVMDDLWRASDSDLPGRHDHHTRKVPVALHIGWAALILSGVLQGVVLALDESPGVRQLYGFALLLRGAAYLLGAAYATALLLRLTARAQRGGAPDVGGLWGGPQANSRVAYGLAGVALALALVGLVAGSVEAAGVPSSARATTAEGRPSTAPSTPPATSTTVTPTSTAYLLTTTQFTIRMSTAPEKESFDPVIKGGKAHVSSWTTPAGDELVQYFGYTFEVDQDRVGEAILKGSVESLKGTVGVITDGASGGHHFVQSRVTLSTGEVLGVRAISFPRGALLVYTSPPEHLAGLLTTLRFR